MRMVASRGSMDLSVKDGGLPPDSVVQSVDAILEDSAALIERWHDPSYGSMRQIALAPCSPFSVSRELLLQSAKLARQYHVRLHTHLAETKDEERYTLDRYGLRPLAYLESLGWVGPDVWFAHGIHFTDTELDGRGALPRFQHEALLRRGAHPRDAAARHPRRPCRRRLGLTGRLRFA